MSRFWPSFHDEPRQRKIAWLEWNNETGGRLYYSDQRTPEKSFPVFHWQDIKALLFAPEPQLELFCNGMLGQSWFSEALQDTDAEVIVPTQIYNKVSQIQAIRVKAGNYTAWVVDIRAWGIPALTREAHQAMLALFLHCGVGVRPTPGSLGQAMMRKAWFTNKHKSLARPSNACRLDLLEHSTGGRVDYFVSPEDHFIEVDEYDIVSAYSSVSTRLPSGTAVVRFAEPTEEEGYTTWFCDCTITIPVESRESVGIFAVPASDGTNEYPTTSGVYRTWLWRDEIEACRQAGWQVDVAGGWGWRGWTTGLATWAEQMLALRGTDNELISKWAKLATVAGIGRFGMPLFRYRLVEEGKVTLSPGDLLLTDSQGETGYALIRESDLDNNNMTHWFSYILMKCRMVLYKRIKRDIALGRKVLMTNYDCIYLERWQHEEVEQSSLFEEEPGIRWKHKVLHHVRFPFPRGLISDEKTTLPGVQEDERDRYRY